jgi:Putative beta-barrel porin 2
MTAAYAVLLLLLLPALAAAQTQAPPAPPPLPPLTAPPATVFPTEVSPRLAPPPTIPAAPDIFVPLPTPLPEEQRPRKVFDFRPGIGLVEEFTDNFFMTRSKIQSNFRSGVQPSFQLLLDDGPVQGQAAYTLLGFYDTRPDELGVHHALSAGVTWRATPLVQFGISDAFARTDDPNRADRLGLRVGRQVYTSNLASANANYTGTLFQGSAYYHLGLFDSSTDETTAHTIGLTGTRSLGASNTLSAGYEYLNADSQRKNVSTTTTETATIFGETPATARDTSTTGHQFTATFTRDLTARTSAGLTGGYALRHQDFSGGGERDFQRWNVSLFNNYVLPERIIMRSNIGVAQLTGDGTSGNLLLTSNSSFSYWFGRAVVSLGADQGFSETFATGANSGVIETKGASGSLSYRFTEKVTGTIGASYRQNKTTGVGISNGATQDDKIIYATANVTYQVYRWLTATLDFLHTDFNGREQDRQFAENRVRFALNAILY